MIDIFDSEYQVFLFVLNRTNEQVIIIKDNVCLYMYVCFSLFYPRNKKLLL